MFAKSLLLLALLGVASADAGRRLLQVPTGVFGTITADTTNGITWTVQPTSSVVDVYVQDGASGNKTLFATTTGGATSKPDWLRGGLTFTLQTRTVPPLVLANATIPSTPTPPTNYTGLCGAAGPNPFKANASAPITPCSTSFLLCAAAGSAEAAKVDCPAGLAFNPTILNCDWPWKVAGCPCNFGCPAQGIFPATNSTSKYNNCAAACATPVVQDCAPGTTLKQTAVNVTTYICA